jgi:hypothetical protein
VNEDEAAAPEAPVAFKPQPVAMSTKVEVIPTEQGVQLVRLMIVTPVGIIFAFFDAVSGDRLGDELKAGAARARLYVPPAANQNGSKL